MQSNKIISLKDYLRPWKLFSLSCGIGILLVGSVIEQAMDWDFGISFIMAISTYLFSPITSRVIFYKKFRTLPLIILAIFGLWFSVDGVYWLYWSIKDADVVEFMRDANFLPSLCLYLMCAFIWLFDGSLKELLMVLPNYRRSSIG
ncbi:MAG: hypothetical protein Q3971_03700 [Moraxella sp.]|nr:hypothetical protein [Moraxella sp.]